MCHIFLKNGHSEGAPTLGEIHPDQRPPPVSRFFIFPFLRFCAILGELLSESSHPMCRFCEMSKAAILIGRRWWAKFTPIRTRVIYVRLLLPILARRCKSNSRIVTPDESHLLRAMPSWGIADCVRYPFRFSPNSSNMAF